MNENVLRTSLSACVSWLAKQITCQLSYWVIFWKMTCLAIRIKLALFHILIAKNPQVLPVIPTKYPKNQKTWMTWFFLQGYQVPLKQPDCVLVLFIDPKIMKLFSWYKPIIWKFEFKVFNKQFIYCWFSIFFPKKCVILIKHVLLHVSLHYLSPINSNLISSHF